VDKPPQQNNKPPAIRQDFISVVEARQLLVRKRAWPMNLRGDLQMHTRWSDGSGTITEMADAATDRSYEYIAITDHSKGLKIAGGIDEHALKKQGNEIGKLNAFLKSGRNLLVLRSVEMKLNRRGEGDMSPESLLALDLVLESFHSSLRILKTKRIVILQHCATRIFKSWVTRAAAFTIFGSA